MKTDNKEPIINDWTSKLAICQACMDHEQSIRSGYQALLTALEATVFGLVFVLVELERTTHLWVLAIAGILLCLIFGMACEFRARNVDFWRRHIVELARGTDLEDAFKRSRYGWIPFGKVGRFGEKILGHWFERALVPAIIMVWVWILTL